MEWKYKAFLAVTTNLLSRKNLMTTSLVRRANYSKISCDCEVVIIVLTKIMQGNHLQLITFATDNHVITHQKHSMKMTKKITRKLGRKLDCHLGEN
jgi:hypothetical protein